MRVVIDGTELEVAAARPCSRPCTPLGATVPTLCFDERQAPFGACRVCMVGVEGAPGPCRVHDARAATGW